MNRACIVLTALLLSASAGVSSAAEPGAPLASRLAGSTLSAVTYLPNPPGSRNGGLSRILLQAYLRPDGRALVRSWDANRNGYTPVAERGWSLSGSTLCIDLPAASSGRFCADVHVWGPRIAGVGIRPYAMLDGDLQPGNILGQPR